MGAIEVGRPRTAADWAAIREICCETGNAGGPIEEERRSFFAEYWICPYQRLAPGWTFIARADGRVVGYLTGCPSSAPFYARSLLFHRLPLWLSVLAGRWRRTSDTARFRSIAEGARRSLSIRFGWRVFRRLFRRYPAHLHVNVRAEYRSAGLGRKLIDVYVDSLRAAGVRGLHLFCGAKPVAFYRRTGFHRLACRDFGRGPVWVMVRRFAKR